MCGICGIIYKDKQRTVEPSILKAMSDAIKHRGPDDEGMYIRKNVGLGFRRLSIIDLQTGHQPLSNEDETIWIVFNGEIYNFQELRSVLQKQGHFFRTKTDSETIVHLYEEYGEQCVSQLRGMFSFVIYDSRTQKIFAARDRFGIKPMYYYQDDDKFLFGSEIKAIMQHPGVDRTIDPWAIDSYLAYGYVTHAKSIYTRIKKLPQSHTLSIDLENSLQSTMSEYWTLQYRPDHSRSEEYWKEKLGDTLRQSVAQHMISDVPLGAFLSGGIDSSSVTALMAMSSSSSVNTFSIGFQDEEFNELKYAQSVASKYSTNHYEHVMKPDAVNLLPKLVRAFDEPFADSSAIPTFYVSQFAREKVTVILSGDGGDELFAGYNAYARLLKIYHQSFVPPPLNRYLWGGVSAIIPKYLPGAGAAYLFAQNRSMLGAYENVFTVPERMFLYSPEMKSFARLAHAEQSKEHFLKQISSVDFVTQLQLLDLKTYLPEDVLTKVDITSMMNSLEVRVPILDHHMAELAFTIPIEYKFKNGSGKHILKQAMQKYIPENVLNHKKQGFAVPLKKWFRNELVDYLRDNLSGNTALHDYCDERSISSFIDLHQKGMRDYSAKLWALLFFSEWLKHQKGSL